MKKTHYAIKKGHKSHVIVKSWYECEKLVTGFSGALFKGFICLAHAEKWLGEKVDKENAIQQENCIYIPATNKRNRWGWKPRYYIKDGIRMAHHGTTIGRDYVPFTGDISIPPWNI